MKDQMFYRHFDLERSVVDDGKRETELAFSSEAPVERWFGAEVLLHGRNNVDLSRLRSVGSVIYGHNPYELKNIVGPIREVWLDEKDRMGRARIGFDDDESGNLAMGKVKSKSLRGVSFGYIINKARRLMDEKEEWTDTETGRTFRGPAVIATRWTPYEISLTPIPADKTVGIGREATRSLDGIEIETTGKNPGLEAKEMDKDEIQKMIRDILKEALPEAIRAIVPPPAAPPTFAVTLEEMRDLNGQAGAISPEAKARVAEMVAEGKTAGEIQRELVVLATKKPDATDTPPPDSNRRDNGITADKINDDVFLRALVSPEMIPFN